MATHGQVSVRSSPPSFPVSSTGSSIGLTRCAIAPSAAAWRCWTGHGGPRHVALVYDGFTFNAVSWIEALGFCGFGEAMDWLDGGLPIVRGGVVFAFVYMVATLLFVPGSVLTVGAGEVYGYLGPNGAGKTTSLRMLLGLIRPDEGSARLFGRDPLLEGARAERRPSSRPNFG